MTEISKGYKIVLLIMAGIGIAYGIFWLFLTNTFYTITGSPYYDPFMARSAGITLLSLGVFNILAAMKAEVEKIRFYIEFMILWLIIAALLIIVAIFDPVVASIPLYMQTLLIALAFYIVSSVLSLYFYFKEIK